MPWYNIVDFVNREKLTSVAAAAGGKMNSILADLRYVKGDAAWTYPALAGGWLNYGAGFSNAGYKMVGDFVVLRGVVKSGAGTIFTLPVGYRPAVSCDFAAGSASAFASVRVAADGSVSQSAGSNAGLSLDGIRVPIV
jgi:hypothetical protein